jgi:phosphohistidine phosphatase
VRTLYLLRHAKSDWSDPLLSDHDRPLAPRGQKAARQMGLFLAEVRPRPGLVLCSSAVRAKATWTAVAALIDQPPEVRIEDALYGATVPTLVARVRRLPPDVEAAMLVGHNPGLEDLAGHLAGEGAPSALRQLEAKFPTAALAILSTDRAWSQVDRGSCYLESVTTPRELA